MTRDHDPFRRKESLACAPSGAPKPTRFDRNKVAPARDKGRTSKRVMAGRMAQPSASSDVIVIGAPRTTLRDFYHWFLRARWSLALGVMVSAYLGLNAIFADAYLVAGGVVNSRAHSFWDAFCFSVQTMGTIGYGSMYPTSAAANAIMIVESVTSLIVTAVATGLVFAKFSRSTARIAFSREAVIGPMDGVPTLMLRVGNERGNQILEATVRVGLIRTEKLKEGTTFYRLYDLALSRERSAAVARSWTVLHPIVPGSPLYGATPESLARDEAEIMVSVVGTDDTSLQPVHARMRYMDKSIVWGARHADVLSEDAQGNLILDVRKFHDIVPTTPIEGFPYPRGMPSRSGEP
jgi:inward rectifier potassium channel